MFVLRPYAKLLVEILLKPILITISGVISECPQQFCFLAM